MQCPQCGFIMSALDTECPRCHGKGLQPLAPAPPPAPAMSPVYNRCARCGTANASTSKFCSTCGLELSPAQASFTPIVATAFPRQASPAARALVRVGVFLGIFLGIPLIMRTIQPVADTSSSGSMPFTSSGGSAVSPPSVPSFSIPVPAPPRYSLSQYSRIEMGMSGADVLAVMGDGGREMSHSEIAGISTAMYMWQNADGSNMNVMIQNGRVVNKAQFGLR